MIAACGVYLLWAATRKQSGTVFRLVAGWLLLIGSLFVWAPTSGADKGVALGIIVIVLVALAVLVGIALQAPQRESRIAPQRTPAAQTLTWLSYSRRFWVGFLIGPVACASAIAICTAVFLGLQEIGFEHTLNLTLVSFALPVVWGLLSIWGGADPKFWRKNLIILGCGFIPLISIIATR